MATVTADTYDEDSSEVKSLYVSAATSPTAVAAQFLSCSADKVIITDAKCLEFASILLLALHSAHSGAHITDVYTVVRDDLIKVKEAKQATCDVSVYSLFFIVEEYPGFNYHT